ncbi:MAG: LTA synthase family protein [Elusimicrobia bacterium]|nr:LTA synthase family protein [Elusimicrobiota bacterium]
MNAHEDAARPTMTAAPAPLGVAALWGALAALRWELAGGVNTPLPELLAAGMARGMVQDFAAALVPTLLAQLGWALLDAPKRAVRPLAASVVWLACLADVLHHRFFGIRLDWWIVAHHWTDALPALGSAAQLAASWPVAASAALALAAVRLGAAKSPADARPAAAPGAAWWLVHRGRLARFAALAAACWLADRASRPAEGLAAGAAPSDNILAAWARQAFNAPVGRGPGRPDEPGRDDPSWPNRVLWAYHGFAETSPRPDGSPPGAAWAIRAAPGTWPLDRDLAVTPEETRLARERLGLPEKGPIHVIMLFLENVRSYELYHPDLGPRLFPNLRRVLARHAIQFKQAYSSSFETGQTVRGQFSALCSMLPNIGGPATYIAHPAAGVRCVQQLLQESGYTTAWMNTYEAAYHGKRAFESRHGTALFFEGKDFRGRGVTQRLGSWGLADRPFLLDVVKLVGELAGRGKPVFANVLTITTHHPYAQVAEGPVPEDLAREAEGHAYYRRYLSGLVYEDKAVAAFFDALFKSPLAGRTLVVLASDHSAPVPPHHDLTRVQLEELRYRIPIALVTRDLPRPEVVETPVHQADVAPTIARVAGAGGRVTWIGRDLLSGRGTPFVHLLDGVPRYRTARRACYPGGSRGSLRCYDVTGRDPLFDAGLREAPEDPGLTGFFRRVVEANGRAIALDLVLRPSHNALFGGPDSSRMREATTEHAEACERGATTQPAEDGPPRYQ